jgi:PTH2 family peptidyl-tRNA hydrolase
VTSLPLTRNPDMANVQDRGPPSAAAIAIGTAIVSGLAGYYIGQAQSIGLFGGSSTARHTLGPRQQSDDDEESDASDAASQSGDVQEVGELKSFAGSSEECKLVLVTRTDLGMGKGKFGDHLFRFRYTSTAAITSPFNS